MRGKMRSPKDEFADIAHKLQEAHLAAQKAKEGLLVYLIERALFQAEKVAAEALRPSDSRVEQSELRDFKQGFLVR
jgi:hypothetical protein